MNKEVEEPQEQPSDRPALREVSPEELAKILEAHRKWVESEGKEGERANLYRANLQGADLYRANLQRADLREANLQRANLYRANLQGADLYWANLQRADLFAANLQRADLYWANLRGARGLNASQVMAAKNWKLAFYSDDFLKELSLPPDHNERVKG